MDYFDLHCDTPYECYTKNKPFFGSGLAVMGEAGACFERWAQCFAVWIRDDAEQPFLLYQRMLSDFRKKLACRPDNLTPFITVEGGAVIEDHEERVERLYADGVRALTLTWNGENRIAGGALTDAPLTDFGRRVIGRMNDLHIACDLSHLNERSFYGVIDAAEFPLATHSNCRAVLDHPRNLTDDQLRKIGERDGVIGLCFYPDFLGGDVFEKLYENIAHLLDLGLENHIAIGSDFDGAKMAPSLDSITKVGNLYSWLACRGIEKAVLDKVFYCNAAVFFARL